MSLSVLVAEDNWQGFDEAWKTLIGGGGPIDELVVSLDLVAQKRRMPRCLPMLRDHAAQLAEAERPEEAARLVGAALRGGGSPGELTEPLFKYAEQAWGEEDWWAAYCELADFHPGVGDVRRSWGYFDDIRSYREGMILFHPAGWGTGEVTEILPGGLELRVRFQSGRSDTFPMRTAVEIFEILPESDLRAQAFRDPDRLRKKLKAEPLEILRSILIRYSGKATSVTLRNALMQVGITGNAWTSWWRRTRLLAENSEWFRVVGSATKAQVQLLTRAVNPIDALEVQLRGAPSLMVAVTRVRDILTGGKLEASLREKALETIHELSAAPDATPAERLSVWMILRDQHGETPEPLAELIRDAASAEVPTDPSTPPELWELLQNLTTARDQDHSATLLIEVLGEEEATEEFAKQLPHATPGMVKPVLDRLEEAGRHDALLMHYASLLARPTRAPSVLIGLARTLETGEPLESLQGPEQRAQALLELAIYLQDQRRGNPSLARANVRLVELLVRADPPLLRRLLDDADPETMRGLRLMMQRGVDDAVDNLITDIAIERGTHTSGEPSWFWEDEHIWTTRAGIRRREAELRNLREVKIPENREAIARAASYGDLSENAEWEQAIREQSELTSLAAQIERELRQVALLEEASIPHDTVAPGTVVRYRDAESGEEHQIILLGPWDTSDEDTVYYRAPLPAGMLGKSAGERVEVELPGGTQQVEILSVIPADID